VSRWSAVLHGQRSTPPHAALRRLLLHAAVLLGVGTRRPRDGSLPAAAARVVPLLARVLRPAVHHGPRETGDAVAGLLAAGCSPPPSSRRRLARHRACRLALLVPPLGAVAAARRATTWQGGHWSGCSSSPASSRSRPPLAAAPMLVFLVVTRRRSAGRGGNRWVGRVSTVISTPRLRAVPLLHRHRVTGQPLDSVQWTKFFTTTCSPVAGHRLAGVGLIVGGRGSHEDAWPFWLAATAGMVGASWVSGCTQRRP